MIVLTNSEPSIHPSINTRLLNLSSATSCPYQPPCQCFRIEAVVGFVKDGLLVGLVALAEPLGPRRVRDAGFGAAAGPDRERGAAVRQRIKQGIVGYGAARLHTCDFSARFPPRCLPGPVRRRGDRRGYWVGHRRRQRDALWTRELQRKGWT